MVTRKQKVGGEAPEGEGSPKEMKPENDYETGSVGAEFDRFCKVMRENLSVEEMRIILEINEQNSSGTNEDVILRRCTVSPLKDFVKLFEELTGNEFEPWEREKKFQKKPR
ncbi:hypothetical protein RHMOL_Rhmol08G0052300 [Rhododendron molle]|uniref:Uncharacterized protein n=1 Tax=Rhododendron molle TaxID=49168 RepID=A0ACC0ML33_RHOML|nr:hypothetical protein RHMOL_Rhmol08G0052300 [Rhododendron molle]